MELFSKASPLAHRMRPEQLEDLVGQEQVLGPGKPLRRWIEEDRLPSLVIWGPPGSGKTTLAHVISKQSGARFEAVSAVLGGVKDLKEAVTKAKFYQSTQGARTVLFVDEIHRFNKGQQDALLPHVEDGTVVLIGATTENPYFEINKALLSRCRIIKLERLSEDSLMRILERALKDPNTGLATECDREILKRLVASAEGDARRALSTLESFIHFRSKSENALAMPEEVWEGFAASGGVQAFVYDADGEEHHSVVSAFIKSMRDSDPDAAMYYLARMLEGGEDPMFIARRLVVFASEDVGNAEPRALEVAVNVKEAVEFVGMPEGRINFAQAVTFLACAPKSRSSMNAISKAQEEVLKSGTPPVPGHLRNVGFKKLDSKGRDYHSRNFPQNIGETRYFKPTESGFERKIKEWWEALNVPKGPQA